MFFVLSPLPGSGQLGGCFVGRVIGLPKRTIFLVVALAGVAVAALYAIFADYLARTRRHGRRSAGVDPCRGALSWSFLILAWLIFKFLRYLGREEPAPERTD